MSLFGFGGPSAKVEVELDNTEGLQKTIEVESEDTKEELFIYSGSDTVKGTVKVIIPSGKKLEHVGIKVELVGTIGTVTICFNCPLSFSRRGCIFCSCLFFFFFIHTHNLYFFNLAHPTSLLCASLCFAFFIC